VIPARERFERATGRLVEAVMAGDDAGARVAFGDAQAVLDEALPVYLASWVTRELGRLAVVGDRECEPTRWVS
jgi:hypothetical protein